MSVAEKSTRIALCGLGPMGAPIAERIVRSGTALTVWNRTDGRSATLSDLGATIAATPSQAAAPIVLTVLPDLAQVEEIVWRDDGLLAGWVAREIADPVLVIHGTTSPVSTAIFAQRMREDYGIIVLDAPLSGGTVGAAAGSLSIMVGGDAAHALALEPLFRAYGRVIRHFGPAGSGALAKACNQVVVASTVAAISESLALAERAGLDPAALIGILEGGLASSEVLRQKKSKWLEDDYMEGGSAANQLKNLRFVRESAESLAIELPVTDAVRTLFARMVERGDGELDHTGVIRTLREGRSDGHD